MVICLLSLWRALLSKDKIINILFIADIVGRPGLDITERLLPGLKRQYEIDICIANGENAAGGRGLTSSLVRQYINIGVDVISSGNHIWDNPIFRKELDSTKNVLRPLNYPPTNPGRGSIVIQSKHGQPVGIINLQGRTFMASIDCPFRSGLTEIDRLGQKTKIIIIDFHAEATAEKMAMGWYLDGKVSAVIGTHTHVQTADERILPQGTAYITDVGMTGAHDSVIGLKTSVAIKRFLHQIPEKYQIASGNSRFCGAIVSINSDTGKAQSIERINLP